MIINVVAVRNKSYFSIIKYLIYIFQKMIFRKDRYNHFAIEIIKLDDFKCEYLDATLKGGVKLNSKENFSKKYKVVKRWHMVGDSKLLEKFEVENIGKKYASEQLFGYVFEQMKIWKNNLLGASSRRIICSELVVLWLKENGFKIINSDEYDLLLTEKLLDENFEFTKQQVRYDY